MEILYCDGCGYRIPEEDIAEGRALRGDDKAYCSKCRLKESPKGKQSYARLVVVPSDPKLPTASSHPVAGERQSTKSVLPRTPTGRTHRAPAPAEKSSNAKTAIVTIVSIVAGLLFAALVFGGGGGKSDKTGDSRPPTTPAPKSGNPAPEPVQPVTPPRVTPPVTPAITPPVTPRTTPTTPEPPATPVAPPVETDPEKLAEKAFDALKEKLAGISENAERATLLEAFLKEHGATLAGAHGRALLSELKPATPETPAPADVPPPLPADSDLPTGPATATLVQRETDTGGSWRNKYGRDGYLLFDKKGRGQHEQALPVYVNGYTGNTANYVWGTADKRSLEGPDGAAATHTGCEFGDDIKLHFDVKDRTRYWLALYCLDFDTTGRKQRVDICVGDKVLATEQLDAMHDGVWLQFEVAGSVDINIKKTAGFNAVISGVFWDPVGKLPAKVVDPATAYAAFQEEFLGYLFKRQGDSAALRLSRAEKDEALQTRREDLARYRKAATWLAALDEAVAPGAARLKDVDEFVLPMSKGAPMRIGKRAKFVFVEVKDGSLLVADEALTVPVSLSGLPGESREKLAVLGLKDDGSGRVLRAFHQLLVQCESKTPDAGAVRTLSEAARAAGADEDELWCLRELLKVADDGWRDRAAETAYREVLRLADTSRLKELKAAVEAFKAAHGTTRFAQHHEAELRGFGQRTDALEKGLVAWWRFDDQKGDVAKDSSGNNHHAKLINGPVWGPGKFGGALGFRGTTDYLLLPDSLIQRATQTFSVWFNTQASGVIFGYQTGAYPAKNIASHVPSIYAATGGKLRASFWGSADQMVSTSNVNDGNWHHVALVLDGDRQCLYLDGAPIGKTNGAANYLDMKNNQLGTGYSGGSWQGTKPGWFFYKGVLDDVRLYDRALTDAEVRLLAGKQKEK